MLITIEIESNETLDSVIRRAFPHLFEKTPSPRPPLVEPIREAGKPSDAEPTPDPVEETTTPSDEELLMLAKRTVEVKGLGLSAVQAALKEAGGTRVSLLAPSGKIIFADRLRAALGE